MNTHGSSFIAREEITFYRNFAVVNQNQLTHIFETFFLILSEIYHHTRETG